MISKIVAFASLFVASVYCADYPTPSQVPAVNPEWVAYVESQPEPARSQIEACIRSNQWAFTFDDGPSPSTAVVLDALARHGQKATFFVIGSNVLQNKDMLKRIVTEGHEVGSHTWSHNSLPRLSVGQIVSELVWTSKIIRDVTGVTPKIVRAPYGEADGKVRKVVTALNMTLVKWNRETNDWKFNAWQPGKAVDPPFNPTDTPDAIGRLFVNWTSQPATGTISLQHDKNLEPVKQVFSSIDIVIKAGYQLTTISECIGEPAYNEGILSRLNVPVKTSAGTKSIASTFGLIFVLSLLL